MAVEGFHCCLTGFGDVGTLQYFLNCGDDYLAVGEEGDMVDVPHVEFKFLSPGDGISSVALRPAGDAGTNLVTASLLL